MKPKYPAMFCKPKPVITNTYYLYQRQYEKALQQPQYSDKQRGQRPQQISSELSTTGGPSMGGLGVGLALDPVSNRFAETTIIQPIDDEKGNRTKAKSEIIFSSNDYKKQTNAKNPAAMLNSNYNNNNNNTGSYDTTYDNVSCIHGHYNINYLKHNNYSESYRPKLIKSSKLILLIPDLLQYRVIQCGYITKRGKIRKNWKKRFALLLCAKINDNNDNNDEKRDENNYDYYFQFKLLYFENDTLSNLRGCISFNNLDNINIGLIAPKSALKTTRLSKHLSTPIRPRHDNEEHSLSVSVSVSISQDVWSNDAHFYKLLKKNPLAHNLQHMWSSFPNYNGFYIIDQNKDRTWFMDTKNFENAKKWLLSIWEIDKYFKINKKSKKSKKKSKRLLKKFNLNEINEVNEIKYNAYDMKENINELYNDTELCLKNGFSDFVSIELEGYVSENIKKNKRKKYETLKYMIIIPNQCHIRFKGILLFDCIDNKYKHNKNNKNNKNNNYSPRKRFKPNFYEKPTKIRMKQKSMFIDKLIKENDRGSNSYFELIGDLTKCLCNARNDKTKTLWRVAFKYYRSMMNLNQ